MEEDMLVVLKHVVRLISESSPACSVSEDTEGVTKTLESNIRSLEKTGYLSDPERVIDLFSNGALIQEIAIRNGWEHEYLELEKSFQSSIDECW